MTDGNIADLEVLLGHVFRDKQFIFNALSHSSTKTDDRPSNERMEFLGDSVLGTICAEALYRRHPDADEGELTRIKSATVSRATLERVAMVMGLDRFILVGKGVRKKAIPSSLIGNLFEAIVGAIYLDAGLAATRKFVLRQLDVVMGEIVEDRAERNYKSMLQHFCQRELGGMPSYRVSREAGPAHSRNYEIAVVVKGEEVGRATAASKKEAEQGAARAALLHYKAIDEQPIETVRGAGTILRVGPVKAKRKPRSRRPRRGDTAPEGKAPEGRDADTRQSEKPAPKSEAAPAPSRGSADADAPDAPATGERGPAHTPLREGESSRRSRGGRRRRGGRGRGGRGRGGQNAPSQENGGGNGGGQADGGGRTDGGGRADGGGRTDGGGRKASDGRKAGGGRNSGGGDDAAQRSDAPAQGERRGGRTSRGNRAPARPDNRESAPAAPRSSDESASASKKVAKKAAKKASKKTATKKTATKKTAKKAAKKKAAKKAAKKTATKKTAKKASKKKATKKAARKPRGSSSSGDSASTDVRE